MGVTLIVMPNIVPLVSESIDVLNVSSGAYGSHPVIVAPHQVPDGFNLEFARAGKPLDGSR